MNSDVREEISSSPAPWTWRTTGMAFVWCAGVYAIYLANGREIGSGDSVPAKYLSCGLVRGDGFYLDRYERDVLKWWPHPTMPYYVARIDGHYVSRYPFGPALLALPFTIPQMIVLDRTHPDWETSEPDWFDTICKRSAAAITTLAALALLATLRKLGLGRVAWLAATAAALGSALWSTASQSLWQHGPAALMLTSLILILWPENPSRWRFFAAGVTAAMLVCCRPIDLAFAVVTAFWVTIRHPRGLIWFLPPAAAIGAALIGYNRAYLGAAAGYYSTFDAATFGTPWYEGLQGTLLSPIHGLFVFTPWALVAFAYMPFAVFQLRRATLLPWLLATLAAHALLISTFSCWWAGLCFGPRYWTEVIPLLAVVLGMALHWAKTRCKPVFVLSLVLIAISTGVEILGAFVYPSSWQDVPPDFDGTTHRFWDWSDNELTRCLVENRAHRALFGPGKSIREKMLQKVVLLPTAENNQPATWRYTTVEPGPGWNARQFNTEGWSDGKTGFCSERMPTIPRNTSWNTPAIWMRTSVEVPHLLPDQVYVLRVAHDDDLTVYLNGVKIYQREGVSLPYGGYRVVVLDDEQAALIREGTNTLAVKCIDVGGDSGVDVGFSAFPK
jgi:hypothetical protein